LVLNNHAHINPVLFFPDDLFCQRENISYKKSFWEQTSP